MTKAGRTTIIDVAQAAGVSRQTVSNAINAPHRVQPATLDRVRAEIDRLGYRPSRAARTLKQERAGAWGLEINARGAGRLGSIVDEFLIHLTAGARRHDSHIVPFVADDSGSPLTAYTDAVAAHLADGYILTDTRHEDPRPGWLRERRIRYAAFGRLWDDPSDDAWVDVDGRAGVRQAVDHLLGAGYERIGYLGWPLGSPVGDDRRAGWVEALTAAGLDTSGLDVLIAQDLRESPNAAGPLLDAVGKGGAIVCASDVLAVGVWELLKDRGWRVGRDVGLVGFDDSDLAHSLRLTSIRQPLPQVAEAVLGIVGGEPEAPRGLLLTPELVIRASSDPAGDRTTERGTT